MPSPFELDNALKDIATRNGTEVRGFWRAVIDDYAAVPVCYERTMLDKQAIVRDILHGIIVPGCRLEWTYLLSDPQREPDDQVSEQS